MSNGIKVFTRWKEVLFLVFLVRLLNFIFTFFVNHQQLQNIFNYWIRWDGPHYIDIARNGYQTSGEQSLFIVFYPLYPLLIKLITYITQNYNLSSMLISISCTFIASILLYEVVCLDFSKRVALLSVWFLNIFPTAYFLQSAYTESLFLTTSLAAIYFFRKENFITSSLAGAFGSMTRINGLLLLPLLLMEKKSMGKNLIALLVIPFGFLGYLFINYLTFKDPFYFSKILSSHWYKELTWPWISIKNLIIFLPTQSGDYYYLFLTELISIFLLYATAILVYLKVRKSYGVYMFFNVLLFTSTNFIMSTPRYSLVLFPIYIALAKITNNLLIILITTVSIILMLILSVIYTQGRWAF